MNKIKIIFLIDSLEGYGAEKSLVELARNFDQVEPVFAHIYQGDMLKAKLESSGIRIYSLDIDKKYAFNQAVEGLIPIYRKEQPDIVHATLFRSEIIARKLKRHFPEICLIGSFVSNAYSQNRYYNKNLFQKLKLKYFHRIDKRTVKYVDLFVSNSHTIKNITVKALGIPEEKVHVIYRGRNSSEFAASSSESAASFIEKGKIKLLNVSRLIPLKGQMDLLKALPEIIKKYPDVKLYLAGHGSYRQELESHVKKYKLQKNVEFLGRIENIAGLLHHCQIFLYPSYSEGLPGALIEAMMAEKIIICSDIPVNLECVDDSCAIIYPIGNISLLVSSIIKILESPEKFETLAQKARKKAKERFELEQVVKQYENFYLHAVSPEKNSKEVPIPSGERTLRILHLIQKPQKRGAETFACQLANHQQKNGNCVKLVSVFTGNATLPWKGEIESLEASSNWRFFDVAAWMKLDQIIKKFKPDILQANSGDTLKYAVLSKKLFQWETPIIFRNASEVGRYLKSPYQKKINSFFYKNVAAVASVSHASQKDLLNQFPCLYKKSEVVPIGIEEKVISDSFDFPENTKNIIHVGGFSFEKNHSGLIRIFDRLQKKEGNVMLHLVGDGNLRESVEKDIVAKNLQDKIKLYGFVDDALPMILKADVLILPSIIEGLPGVLLEAMYCKTPVIAYNVGGINEIVGPETGILVPEGNEKAFAKAISLVLNGENSSVIEKANHLVLKKYLNKNLVVNFDVLYRKIIDSKEPKSF